MTAQVELDSAGSVVRVDFDEGPPSDEVELARQRLQAAVFAPARRGQEPIASRTRVVLTWSSQNCGLRGVVVDDLGEPIESARVRLAGIDFVTDATGLVEAEAIARGRYSFLIEANGMEALRGHVEVPNQTWAPSLNSLPDASAEVTVTASRVATREDDALVPTEVLDRERLVRIGARDAAEALEEAGGVQIERTFRGATLSLRGLDPDYTLILVDGERQPGASGGGIDLERYGIENIERIEIVRGPSSALYGSEAIGGVVNIITRDSDEPLQASALVSGGTGSRYDATGFVGVRPTEGLRVSVGGGFHDRAAFSRDEDGESTDGSARRQWSANGAIRLDPSRAHRLMLRADYTRTDVQGVEPAAGGATLDRRQLQERSQTSLEHRLERGAVSMRSRVSLGVFREQFQLDQRGANALDRYEDNRELLGQLSSVIGWKVSPRHAVTLGFEQLFQGLDSERLADRGRRFRLAAFGQYTGTVYESGSTRLALGLGLRGDMDSQFGSQLSPKLALRLRGGERWSLRASYGRGFRAPSFQELLLRFENTAVGYVVDGNPELGAERSHGVDVGGRFGLAEGLDAGLTFFRNDVRGMIAVVTRSVGEDGTQFSYGNLESAWTMGVETDVRYRFERSLRLNASYTWLLSETEGGRRIEGRPTHRVQLAPSYQHPRLNFGFTVRGVVQVGRTYYGESGAELVGDPLWQLDARAYARFFDQRLEAFVGIDNAIDSGDQFTTLQPRSLYAGVRGRI